MLLSKFRNKAKRMLEILIMLVATLFLAKRYPKRRRYNLRPVRVTPTLALATLASQTALTVVVAGTTDIAHRCISITGTWNISVNTNGEGPIVVGYAHDDYTVAEIKECIEAGDISSDDKIAQERGNRLVRIVGTFSSAANNSLQDGRPIKTRLNWLIATGAAVNMFCYNDGAAGLTTGSVVKLNGTMQITRGT